MIDEKKIEKAASGYSKTLRENQVLSFAYRDFKAGVHWAIDEFLNNLWHDASEEPNPKLNAWIILQPDKDSWEIVKYGGYNKDGGQTWQREAEKGHVLRWCYLSDILPQEKKGGSDV